MTKRVYYTMDGNAGGYVMATDRGDHYTISWAQYFRTLRKHADRPLGSSDRITFMTDKPIRITDIILN